MPMIVQTTLVHGPSLPYAGLCSYRMDILGLPPTIYGLYARGRRQRLCRIDLRSKESKPRFEGCSLARQARGDSQHRPKYLGTRPARRGGMARPRGGSWAGLVDGVAESRWARSWWRWFVASRGSLEPACFLASVWTVEGRRPCGLPAGRGLAGEVQGTWPPHPLTAGCRLLWRCRHWRRPRLSRHREHRKRRPHRSLRCRP